MYAMRTSTLRPGMVGANDGRDGPYFGRWCFKSGWCPSIAWMQYEQRAPARCQLPGELLPAFLLVPSPAALALAQRMAHGLAQIRETGKIQVTRNREPRIDQEIHHGAAD